MFIWTISDAIGVIFWGLALLAVLGFLALVGINKLQDKFKAWRSR